jgi:hypothetical protein
MNETMNQELDATTADVTEMLNELSAADLAATNGGRRHYHGHRHHHHHRGYYGRGYGRGYGRPWAYDPYYW